MATLVPPEIKRAIYLDADMLVRGDLANLWDEPQGDHPLLAVPEIACPYFDAPACMPNFENCREYLCAHTPIMNYRELGLPPDGRYFNGGLLVVDLDCWRRENLGQQMLDCLRENREHVLWWDQYALNVVLAGRWRPLDYRWNQGTHVYVYPDWSNSPIDREMLSSLRNTPWIVHFCSPSKPWHHANQHPFRRAFFECLDRTSWKGWRPEGPARPRRRWWEVDLRRVPTQWMSRVRFFPQAARRGDRKTA
jgi:lipopolysaccharide biosynthesis glycosyltransferase